MIDCGGYERFKLKQIYAKMATGNYMRAAAETLFA